MITLRKLAAQCRAHSDHGTDHADREDGANGPEDSRITCTDPCHDAGDEPKRQHSELMSHVIPLELKGTPSRPSRTFLPVATRSPGVIRTNRSRATDRIIAPLPPARAPVDPRVILTATTD